MRRALAPAAALLFIACGREPEGPGAVCPHDPSFDRSKIVSVVFEPPPTVLRRDRNLLGVSRESEGTVGSGRLQGLTVVEHQLSFKTLVSVAPSRGRACVWFDKLEVDVRPSAIQIFVPSEYPDGSCEYEAVLAHEREHDRVHRERLELAAGRIKEALLAARWLPGEGNPLEAADKAAAEVMLDEKVKKVVRPVYDEFKTGLAAAQAELDTPGLYQWVTKRCSNWK